MIACNSTYSTCSYFWVFVVDTRVTRSRNSTVVHFLPHIPINCTPAQGYRFLTMSDYSDDGYSDGDDGSTREPSVHVPPAPVPAPQTVMTPLGEASADAGAVPAGTSASDELLITRLRRLVTMKQTRLKVRTCTLLHAPRPCKRTLWWLLLGGRLGDAGLGPWACSGVCGGGLGLIFALSSSSAAPAAFADPGPPVR